MKKFFSKADSRTCTSLKGKIETTFDDLVEAFGKPHMIFKKDIDSDNKIQVCWAFKIGYDDYDYKFSRNTVVTIYDYKQDKPVGLIKTWHIGGSGDGDAKALTKMINSMVGKSKIKEICKL